MPKLVERLIRDTDLYSEQQILNEFLKLETGDRETFLKEWALNSPDDKRGTDVYRVLKRNLSRPRPDSVAVESSTSTTVDLRLRCAKCEVRVESLKERLDDCRVDLRRSGRSRKSSRQEIVHKVETPGWVWPVVIGSAVLGAVSIGVAAAAANSD